MQLKIEREGNLALANRVLAKREWVGLTKEECWELLVTHKEKPFSFLIAVEAKLKEKNT
jgi:hypothetical protein